MKNLKKLITIGLAACLVLSLAACTNNDKPDPTDPIDPNPPTINEEDNNDNNIVIPPVENPDPEEPENPVIEDPSNEEKPVLLDELTYMAYPDLGIEITLPESWSGKYFVETVDDTEDEYPTLEFKTVMDEVDENNENLVLPLMYMNVDITENIKDAYGEDFISNMSNSRLLGEYGEYSVLISWPENNPGLKTLDLILDAQIEGNIYCFIPEPVIVPEEAQPLVDAIHNARSDEDNQYMGIVADPTQTIYLDIMRLTPEMVESFAISTSLMNVKAYSVSVIKPADGQTEAVKAALDEYVAATVQSFENYLPDQLAIAQNAIVEEVNGYFVLVMCEGANDVFEGIETAVKAF